ncbi:uncharacterized protein LOC130771086 [Actinidia eriantha]|uniref:uncharacterized protein LOC130771086 n=1 Tax=Actinidia eriantha TaxID=165200 RepID=UPI00258401D9|nr:uncharacterized protein LOC130771086 [Actinidia eriantha]
MASSRRRMLADRGILKLMDLKLLLEENMSDELETLNPFLHSLFLITPYHSYPLWQQPPTSREPLGFLHPATSSKSTSISTLPLNFGSKPIDGNRIPIRLRKVKSEFFHNAILVLETPHPHSSSALSRSVRGKGITHHLLRRHRQNPPGTIQQLFNNYLLKINKELSFVQLELRACRNQYDSSVYYGVVNNVVDEQSKFGTKCTVPQIAFCKDIIEAIAQDAAAKGSRSNIDALNIRLENQVPTGAGSLSQDTPVNIPPAFKNFSLSQKEKTLEELVRDQWLCSTPDGNIGLGLRSFLDLRSWFRNNDIPACEVCNEAGIKVERVCPGCGTPWLLPVSKTEAVEEDEDNANGPTQSQPPPGSSTRKRLRTS